MEERRDCARVPAPRVSAASRIAQPDRAMPPSGLPSALEIDLVALDHRVGEELLTHRLDGGAGAVGIALGEIEVDHLALAHLIDAAESQGAQRMRDGLALGIEHALLQHDMNARLHRARPIARSADP